MINNNFFTLHKDSFTLKELLQDVVLGDIATKTVNDFCSLEDAKASSLSFFVNNIVSGDKYLNALRNTKASFCLVQESYKNHVPKGTHPIVCQSPRLEFSKILSYAYRDVGENGSKGYKTMSNGAMVDNSATIENNVTIDSGAYIGQGVTVGSGSHIGHNVVLGNNVQIGNNVTICENSVIKYATIGDNTTIYQNVTIGKEGFGFDFDKQNGTYFQIPHLGTVVIGKNVRIGASTCIDRGSVNDTVIEDSVQLDNLIQVGHNVTIGTGTVIAGMVAIAGSTKIGTFCMIGGKVGIVGHIKIGNHNIIHGASNVTKSTADNVTLSSVVVAVDAKEWNTKQGMLNMLAKRGKKLLALLRHNA